MEIFVLGATFDWGLVGPFFSLGNFVYRKSLIFIFGANYFVIGHCKTYVDHVRVSLLTRAENFRMVDIGINAQSTIFLNLQIKYCLFSTHF